MYAQRKMIVQREPDMLNVAVIHKTMCVLQILAGCAILAAIIPLAFWIDISHKELLVKGYFILSVVIFIASLIISI